MPTTLIIGGSGKVAKHLTRLLVATPHNHTVHSLIRSEKHISDLTTLGATPILHSIEDTSVSSLASVMRDSGASTIVWSAGAGGGDAARTVKVDRDGAIKAFDAAAESGVKRFIIVSAIDVRDREKKPVPSWYNDDDKARSDMMWDKIGTYMKSKLEADRELVTGNEKRGLEYTIVRPGGLSDEQGTGKVDAGKVHSKERISREDVARVIVQCMLDDKTIGSVFDVVGGSGTVEEEVGRVVKENINSFQGYY